MKKILIAALISTVAAVAIPGGAAFAKRAADDPAGHVRQGRGADDATGHVRHGGEGAGHR